MSTRDVWSCTIMYVPECYHVSNINDDKDGCGGFARRFPGKNVFEVHVVFWEGKRLLDRWCWDAWGFPIIGLKQKCCDCIIDHCQVFHKVVYVLPVDGMGDLNSHVPPADLAAGHLQEVH